jgi:GNAT superfamily N-acetyltransferase
LTADDEIAGHLVVTADGSDSAMVERLFVDPQRMGAGFGRQLLDYAITFAEEQRRSLILDVVDSRQATANLYRKAGWHEAGRIPISWGGDRATHMIRFEAPLSGV